MNIYIEIEVCKRELSGKLLIALELIKKNHNVYLTTREAINKLAKEKKIPPGVIFLKDMNCQPYRILDYKRFKDNGFKIVSQDEEIGCFKNNNFKDFFENRFKGKNSKAFKLIDKYFCWGDFDYNFLKKLNFKTKFFKTGSSRIDISTKITEKDNFYLKKKLKLKKKIILVSLNQNLFWKRDLLERYKIDIENITKKNRLFEIRKSHFENESKDLILIFYLYELIEKLSSLSGFSLIIRPHPAMDEEKVKNLFSINKNIKISSDYDLIDQISLSEIVLNTGCTSTIEGLLNNKLVICYFPKDKYLKNYKKSTFVNSIGNKFSSKEIIIKKLKKYNYWQKRIKNKILKDKKIISKRVLIDGKSFKRIANEINNIKLGEEKHFIKSTSKAFRTNLKILFKENVKKALLKLRLKEKSKTSAFELKFPPIDFNDVRNKVKIFNKIFNIKIKYKIKKINSRCIELTKKI